MCQKIYTPYQELHYHDFCLDVKLDKNKAPVWGCFSLCCLYMIFIYDNVPAKTSYGSAARPVLIPTVLRKFYFCSFRNMPKILKGGNDFHFLIRYKIRRFKGGCCSCCHTTVPVKVYIHKITKYPELQ